MTIVIENSHKHVKEVEFEHNHSFRPNDFDIFIILFAIDYFSCLIISESFVKKLFQINDPFNFQYNNNFFSLSIITSS